jgi:uncharacterized membrane protein YoaK (UPF0700 family)
VLLGVLVVVSFGLVPGQSLTALGFEVTGTGFAVWGICVRSQARAYRDPAARQWLLHRVVWTQLATLPFIIGGALIISGHPSGLYWLVPGVLASFAAGIQNAWVVRLRVLQHRRRWRARESRRVMSGGEGERSA